MNRALLPGPPPGEVLRHHRGERRAGGRIRRGDERARVTGPDFPRATDRSRRSLDQYRQIVLADPEPQLSGDIDARLVADPHRRRAGQRAGHAGRHQPASVAQFVVKPDVEVLVTAELLVDRVQLVKTALDVVADPVASLRVAGGHGGPTG